MKTFALLACLAGLPGLAAADEFDGVAVDGILPDADFFRLATCGAHPGGPCRDPAQRWSGDTVSVALLPGDTASETATAARVSPALDRAIKRINRVGSGITLSRTQDPAADIRVFATDIPEGTVLSDGSDLYAAGIMGVGYVTLWGDDANRITRATILFSTEITDADLPSVVLEELFQALGPRFDVEGAAYEGVSILSQDSNATLDIKGQDARLLRWLYP